MFSVINNRILFMLMEYIKKQPNNILILSHWFVMKTWCKLNKLVICIHSFIINHCNAYYFLFIVIYITSYTIFYFTMATPMLMCQSFLGQYGHQDLIRMWRISPAFIGKWYYNNLIRLHYIGFLLAVGIAKDTVNIK